jgi:hypothetical protein
MDSRRTRWRRATTASIVLHLSLMLVAWWWWAQPRGAVVHVSWYEIARAMADQGYVPAELIPIELPEWTGAAASTTATWIEEPIGEAPRSSEASEPRRDRQDPQDSQSDGERPTPLPTDSGLLRGREDPERARSLGLAGGGEHAAVDPDLLRGSAALYAASVPRGEAEGPRRPNEGEPAGDDYSFVREGNEWIYRDPGGSFIATLQDDGGVEFRNKLVEVSVGSMPGLSGNGENFVTLKVEYDPVGVARLARGLDPSPRVKAHLLAATFEMRLEIATKYHKQRLLDQLNGLQDEIDAIWNRSGLSVAERKRLLFERWDECEEAGGEFPGFQTADASVLDESRRAYAKAARQKIIRFVRSVVPKDGADGYTVAELEQLNQRRVSTQAFAPYDS